MTSIDVRYSKDGGHNWSEWRVLDMGHTGDFCKQVQMRRLGQGRQWVFDIRVTDPVRCDILAASVMLEGSDS